MERLIGLLLLLCIIGCKTTSSEKKEIQKKVVFNQSLADELKRMAKIDQIAAYIPQGEYKKMSEQKWNAFKDSVFTTHQKRLKEIFDMHGFVGYDLAGEEGSNNFWVMVQHSDHNLDFQKKVLKKMKIEVDQKNALSSNYGLLVDRVKINSGEKQIYGTQITYNLKTGQAYCKNLADSLHVNKRRASIGLKPLEEYLNSMTEMHFEMNKKYYTQIGITKPNLYKINK